MLTACPSADVRQFILLPQTDLEREVNPALVQSEFWKHGCTHRITDESREIQNARQASDWRLLAERASKEMDPGEADKRFVLELSCVLDGQQRQTLHFRSKTKDVLPVVEHWRTMDAIQSISGNRDLFA